MSSVNLPNEDAMVSPTLILYEEKKVLTQAVLCLPPQYDWKHLNLDT